MPPGAGSSKGKDEANPIEHDEDVARSIALRNKQNRKRNHSDSDSDSDSSTDTPLKKRPKAKAAGKTKRKPRKPRQKPDPYYKSHLTPSQARNAARNAAERGDFHTLALLEPSARMGKDGKPYVAKGVQFRDSGTKESFMPIFQPSTMYDVFTEFLHEEIKRIYVEDYNMDGSEYQKALDDGTAVAVLVDPTAIAEAHEKFGKRVVTVAKKTDGSVNPKDFVVSEDESDCSDFNPEDFGCYDTDCNDASDGSDDSIEDEEEAISSDEEERGGKKHQDKDEDGDDGDDGDDGEGGNVYDSANALLQKMHEAVSGDEEEGNKDKDKDEDSDDEEEEEEED